MNLHYDGIFFENENEFNKAVEVLKENNINFDNSNAIYRFCLQEAEYRLKDDSSFNSLINKDEEKVEITDELIYSLANELYDTDGLIDSEVITMVVSDWIDENEYEQEEE